MGCVDSANEHPLDSLTDRRPNDCLAKLGIGVTDIGKPKWFLNILVFFKSSQETQQIMNKRNLVMQAAVSAALAATFGAANASTIGISAPAAAIAAYASGYTIAAESTAANYAVNLDATTAPATVNGNAPPAGTIRWVPTFGLNTGDVCTFTFTNARYMSADVKLLGEEAIAQQPNSGGAGIDINNDADIADVIEVASNFGTLDATNGVTSVQVRINNGLNLPTGINLVLAKSVGTNAAGVLTDFTSNPLLRIPLGTGTGNVTIASACTTSGGLAIGAAAASNTIIDLETQIAMTLTGATSVADVGSTPPPRTKFVEEGGAGDVLTSANDSDLTVSAALYTFNNDGDTTVEDFITLVAGDTLTFTLTSSGDLGALATGAGASFVEAAAAGSGTTDDANFAFTLVSPTLTSAAIPGTSLPARGATMSDDIVITVDGTTVVANRTFTGSAALNFASGQYTDATFNLGTTHTWTTNGTILHSPWFSTAPGYISRFVLSNTGTTDAPYTTLCLAETGNTPTLGASATGTVPAGAQLVLTTTDVCTFSGNTRGAIEFTVNGPTTTIQGVYNIVNATTGSLSVSNMMRPGTN